MLALAIGATTAIFTAFRAILLRPLPYPDPSRLVEVVGFDERKGQEGTGNLSVPDVMDFQRQSSTIDVIGAFNGTGSFTLTGSGEAERVPRMLVTSGYFRALGVQPALGRLFRADEDRQNPPGEAVISNGFWQRHFGGDPAIVGRQITLSGVAGPIIGVLPQTYAHPDPRIESAPDVFVLIDQDESNSPRSGRFVHAVARLKEGISVDQASSELKTIAARLGARYPAANAGRSTRMRPLDVAVTADARTPLWVLQAATFAILLIACANLANLLLGAGAGRSNEIIVRTALGARRTRIVRQLLTESLVLAAAGGTGGVLLAWWSTAWLTHAASHMLLPGQALHFDVRVLSFAIALTLAVGVLFGLAPAVQVSRMSVVDAGRRHTGGPAGGRLRSGLIAAEVALSVLLLASAVLLIRSFERLTHVDPGFRATQVITFQVAIPASMYQRSTPAVLYERLYARLRRLPGIDAVAGVNILPLSGNYSCDGMQIEGHEVPPGQMPCAEVRSASVDYFHALGIPLLRGRLFTSSDDERSKHVILINEALARRYFPGEDPIGRRIVYASRLQNDPREIVGVIGDVHHFGLDTAPTPEFYTPELQPPTYAGMTVVLHGEGDPDATIPAVRTIVREFAPTVPVYNVRTLAQLIDASTTTVRTRTVLLGLFAALALVLSLVGTYGVVSIVVSQRVREIGIRLALGASPRDILKLIVGGGLKPILTGGAVGLSGAIVAGRALGGLLFHVSPDDPVTFGSTVGIILVTGFVATWMPARRASMVDPASALRME